MIQIEFTPKEVSEIKFSCWMQMVWGKFIVTEDGETSESGELYQEEIEEPIGGSCDGSEPCAGL
ncbi:hypothetical protein KKH43_03025 [Patescibacteria group bacterium]|nr:hypothetical protein [Patescibacteria group bacterium]